MSGIDSFTTLMLHMNGADASTTFTDNAPVPHTITRAGDAQIDTAQSVFGGASALFDGTGDYVFADGAADLAFRTGDFTVDFRVRFTTVTGTPVIFDFRSATVSSTPATLLLISSNFAFRSGNNSIVTGTTSIHANTWYHVAITRSGTTTRIFLDGVEEDGNTDSNDYLIGANRPTIGISGFSLTLPIAGWVDEFRLSKGIARWTSDFTPPTEAYSRSFVLTAAASAFTLTGKSAGLVHHARPGLVYRALPPLVKRRSFTPPLGV